MSKIGAYLASRPGRQVDDAPRDTAPDERAGHGQDLAMSDGVQHVRSAVSRLLADRSIGDAERVASERWYRDFALVVHGACDPAEGAGGGGASGWLDAVVAAGRSHDAAREAVGEQGYVILVACVAEGLAIASLAHNRERQAWLRGFLSATLRTLTAHYAAVDNARRQPPRPGEPMERVTGAGGPPTRA